MMSDYLRFLQLFIERFVQFNDRLAQHQPEEQGGCQIPAKIPELHPVGVFVESSDTFAQRHHAVRKRQEYVQLLEKHRRHFDRERAARACHLNDQQHDADRLADISKRYRQRVDHIHKDDACKPPCEQEIERMLALNLKKI